MEAMGTSGKEAALKALLLGLTVSPGSTLISCVPGPSLPRHDLTPLTPEAPEKRLLFPPTQENSETHKTPVPCQGPGSPQ